MTAREFRAAIHRLGLTQTSAAKVFGVRTQSVHRWCSELSTTRRQVPPPVERLLYAMERAPELVGILEWYDPKGKRRKTQQAARQGTPMALK